MFLDCSMIQVVRHSFASPIDQALMIRWYQSLRHVSARVVVVVKVKRLVLITSVAPEGKNAIDGLVAVLTVKIVSRPQDVEEK